MTRHPRTRIVAIALIFLVSGMAIGFSIPRPAQIIPVSTTEADRLPRTNSGSSVRNVWSPDIRHDNYYVREQLKIVELLEQQCRTKKTDCKLAEAARQSLDRNSR